MMEPMLFIMDWKSPFLLSLYHYIAIQAAPSKMNALDSLPTAKSIANMFGERQEACVTVSAEQIRTQVCAGSRGLA